MWLSIRTVLYVIAIQGSIVGLIVSLFEPARPLHNWMTIAKVTLDQCFPRSLLVIVKSHLSASWHLRVLPQIFHWHFSET